ncbi:glycosyltransferase involved in cell wall biosynthesis [Paraburkholderia sp. UCT70]|uniref:glycosyltransferase family 4 protein n=1 Tax=Paraburkholderia sp. UCT70 TaxID=2991068 RepID=UPI003D1E8C1B
MKSEKKLQVLLEMRPALDGFAGIPQETRLLFRGLCMIDTIDIEGLLQTSLKFLAPGMSETRLSVTANVEETRLNCYSRVIVSMENKPSKEPFKAAMLYLKRRRVAYSLIFSTLFFRGKRQVRTSKFESRHFEDYIWQTLFAKTLHPADFDLVTTKNYRVCTIPWNVLQSAGLNSRKFSANAVYPVLDTKDADILIAQTPYPARVGKDTVLVVRYHDALPVFMPHAFANKSRHQATHFRALQSNVQSGAYFACVSESTRQDLIRLFPEAIDRAATIHNMVSHHFYEEDSSGERVRQIVRSRLNLQAPAARPEFRALIEQEDFYKRHLDLPGFKYLLMVATIEPRKNHGRLIAAWEIIRAEFDPCIKLVIVGSMGWNVEPIMREMRTWIDQGALFVLNNVPASDLRVLYRHAEATVCPSLAEGFDFSGVECMRSGGIAIASDIAVHREVYRDAVEYFEPYSTESLVDALKKVLYDPNASKLNEELRVRGREVSLRYLPETILPQWDLFLRRAANGEAVGDIFCAAGEYTE